MTALKQAHKPAGGVGQSQEFRGWEDVPGNTEIVTSSRKLAKKYLTP
jgi:hypothetical protein